MPTGLCFRNHANLKFFKRLYIRRLIKLSFGLKLKGGKNAFNVSLLIHPWNARFEKEHPPRKYRSLAMKMHLLFYIRKKIPRKDGEGELEHEDCYISRRNGFGLLERIPRNRAIGNYIIGLYVIVDRDNSNFIFKYFFKINSFVLWNLHGIRFTICSFHFHRSKY